MGRLKNFEIMLKESAAHDDAAEYIRRLKRENARLIRENKVIIDENDTLKNEIQALKNFCKIKFKMSNV